MMKRNIFIESQKFASPSLFVSMGAIYLTAVGALLYANYMQLVLNEPWGLKPITDSGLLILTFFITIVIAVSAYLLFGSVMKTNISKSRIEITFKPFINKPVVFKRIDINKFEVRKYKPIKEFGGWGIKDGSKKNGKAYNVSGNIGLQLYLKSGKKVLIGTRREDAIAYAMRKMMEGENG